MNKENIKKSLKRFLKRKISVNESVITKFLITGLIGASLTACGGGGGSSGGVTPLPPVNPDKPPVVDPEKPITKPVENVIGKGEINDENVILQGNITDDKISNKPAISVKNSSVTNEAKINLAGEKATAISAVNSTVENKSDITLSGEKAIALKGEANTVLRNKAFEISIKNNGNIYLNGQNSIGILVTSKNGSISGINNGNITVSKNLEEEPLEDENMDIYLDKFAYGMIGNGENTTITNSAKGIININGSAIGMYTKNGKAINEGTINIKNDVPDNGKEYKTPIGIIAEGKGVAINKGTIKGVGNELQAMFAFNGGTIINEGKIDLKGDHLSALNGLNATVINKGEITATGHGIELSSGKGINEGTIISTDENEAVLLEDNASMTNEKNGNIKISGDYVIGINAHIDSEDVNAGKLISGTEIINNGLVEVSSKNIENNPNLNGEQHSTGIYLGTNDGTASVKNNGTINMIGDKSVGVYAYNGKIENNGNISVTGDMGTGLYIAGSTKGEAINTGNIIVKGNESDGILAEEKTTATNNGVITVIGEYSYGMTAVGGSTVINNSKGVININGKNSYGMTARGQNSKAVNKGTINVGANSIEGGGMIATSGGIISNEGTINIDSSLGLNEGNKKDFALKADENSKIENYGKINSDGKVTIVEGTNYVIGTNKNGSYGKISANSIDLNGNVIVDSSIVTKEFKNNYILENVIDSNNITLGENSKFSSNSLLYDANSKENTSGKLDAELSRNENNLVDFTSKEYDSLATLFDKGINDKEFRNNLSNDAKDVLNDVFANTSSEKDIQNRIKEISGVEYSNIARQIFDTKDVFKSYDNSIINTLDDYQFNFNFIGDYSDIEAKNNLLGYESQMTGIVGAMKFNNNLYGVIGYGYNDIEFDGNSEGNIKSIHTGIYKDMKINSFDIRMGIFGEYNFHEVERNIVNASSDFNSYLIGATGEISQKFGDSLYVKPALTLDVTYGKYEDFTEEGAKGYNLTLDSQDYTSIVPAVEVKVGKDFDNISLYSGVKVGYEFGDMNKTQNITFNEFGKYQLETDNIENTQTDVKIGTAFEFNNFSFNTEIGKNFGKRDREYIKAGFTYTF